MKLILLLLFPFASALKGALIIEKLYNTSISTLISDTQQIGLNIYAYAHNQSSKFTNMITQPTENIHAISLYFSPAIIVSINSTIDYVVSSQKDTLILYSATGINDTFLASIHIATQSNDWIQNLHSISRLEILNSLDVSEDVNWRDTANIIVRSNIYPSFEKCYLQLQSYRDVNTLSLHFNTSTDLYNSMTIPSTTLSVVNSSNTLVFYTVDADDNAIINPGIFSLDTSYQYQNSTVLVESDPAAQSLIPCEILENITSVTDCIDDTTHASSAKKTCSQHVTDNEVTSLCDGDYDDSSFNASFACCACQGGYTLHSTAAQNTTGIVSDTTLLRLDGRNDQNIEVDDSHMYMTKVLMTFNQTQNEFAAQPEAFSLTPSEIASGIFSINDPHNHFDEEFKLTTIYQNMIKYKFTFKTQSKTLARIFFHYAQRILPFSSNLSIDSVDIFSVPNHVLNISHTTIAQEWNIPINPTCTQLETTIAL